MRKVFDVRDESCEHRTVSYKLVRRGGVHGVAFMMMMGITRKLLKRNTDNK